MAYQIYYKRKELGLCGTCGKRPPIDGKSMCEPCSEKNRKKANEIRQFRLSMGFCPICGRNKLFGEEKTCIECKALMSNLNAKNPNRKYSSKTERKKQYARERRKKSIENGICSRCNIRKPRTGKKTCYVCAEKSRIKYAQTSKKLSREQRQERGLCYFCDNPRKAGMKVCEKHHRVYLEMDKNVKTRTD